MLIIGNKGITLIVGALLAATALIAYLSPLAGNDKVTVTLIGVLVSLVVADLLKRRLYGDARPDIAPRDEDEDAPGAR
ncbi:hypothetical protein [Brachybacterium phenoliresistens]|uniref:hypothetical protein n=1 Tax=Brachybacterium phenoliresistens TaxID=396014 RepID=UPI0031E03D85